MEARDLPDIKSKRIVIRILKKFTKNHKKT